MNGREDREESRKLKSEVKQATVRQVQEQQFSFVIDNDSIQYGLETSASAPPVRQCMKQKRPIYQCFRYPKSQSMVVSECGVS
jgi:hypothetical protein